MRLVLTTLTYDEIKPRIRELVDRLFERSPAGSVAGGFIKLSTRTSGPSWRGLPVGLRKAMGGRRTSN